MKDSVTYQWIVEQGMQEGLEKGLKQGIEQGREQGIEVGVAAGRVQEARDLLLRVGRRRLGEPNASTIAAVQSIESLLVLEALFERILDVETWDDLLSQSRR